MPKKRMGTVQDLRTAQKARLRSKPRMVGQEFLDLFILSKLKERFEREQERVNDGLKYVLKDISDIAKEVDETWAADKAAIERAKESLNIAETRQGGGVRPKRTARGGKRPIQIDY